MRTIAVLSQKGGAGKTTLAVHLAVAYARSGVEGAAIIDLDPQASAAKWGDRREAELPVVLSAHATRLPQEMQRVRDSGGELLILDTAPHSDSVAVAAAKAADLVVVPCKPSILDIEAVGNTIELVKTTATPLLVVLNGVAPAGSEADEAETAIRDAFDAPVCPARLTGRVAFARSLVTGLTAPEYIPPTRLTPDEKATAELARLHAIIDEQLQVITGTRVHNRAGASRNPFAIADVQDRVNEHMNTGTPAGVQGCSPEDEEEAHAA